MGIKLTEWRLKLDDNIASRLAKADQAFDKTKAKAKDLQNNLNNSGSLNAKPIRKAEDFMSQIPAIGGGVSLLSSRFILASAGAGAFISLAKKGYETALDWEYGMAKVNATTQLGPEGLDELKAKLKVIGLTSGGNFDKMPESFEKIVSRVNDVNKSLSVLSTSTKVAKAGFVDIDLAAESIAQTLSITGGATSANEIADTFLKAKAVGAGEFKDFAQYMPTLIAAGKNLNVDYKTVAGLFSFMTQKTNAADASMFLQNAFTAMGKSDIQKGLARQGIRLFDKDGNMRDLGAFFQDLNARLSKFNTEGKSNFLENIGLKDVQAKNAFAVLSDDAEHLVEMITQVKNSAGEMKKQLAMTGNTRITFNEAADVAKGGLLAIGDLAALGMQSSVKALKFGLIANAALQGQDIRHRESVKLFKADQQARTFAKKSTLEKGLMTGTERENYKYDKLHHLPRLAQAYYNDAYRQKLSELTGLYNGNYAKWFNDKTPHPKPKNEKPPKKPKNPTLENGIENVSEGGRTMRYVSVNFKNLVEKIEIKPQTLKEGTNEVVADIEEMLVRAINGAERSMINE